MIPIIKKIAFLLIITSTSISSEYILKPITKGLNKPLAVINRQVGQSNLLFIAEQGGRVIAYDLELDEKFVFLDISDRSFIPRFPADERGLLGIELRKDLIYVNYINKEGSTVVSSFKIDRTKMKANLRTEQVILSVSQPYSNHNGGHLLFGPDNFLYIGLGDGGSAGDPMSNAQDLTSMLGKMLRIDPIDSAPGYLIPDSNPFANNSKYRNEIWAYGLRNPWRYSFDKITGDLYIADVGQSNWEEVNIISKDDKAPHNLGWNIFEGNECYESNKCTSENHHIPEFVYSNNANYIKTIIGINDDKVNGCSITGGIVYRGSKIPDLYGKYIFGDYCTGKLWTIYKSDNELVFDDIGKRTFKDGKSRMFISSFGEDLNKELFIVDYRGSIYMLDSQ